MKAFRVDQASCPQFEKAMARLGIAVPEPKFRPDDGVIYKGKTPKPKGQSTSVTQADKSRVKTSEKSGEDRAAPVKPKTVSRPTNTATRPSKGQTKPSGEVKSPRDERRQPTRSMAVVSASAVVATLKPAIRPVVVHVGEQQQPHVHLHDCQPVRMQTYAVVTMRGY